MALFCAAIRRDLVSFLNFPFLSHIQIALCEISLACLLKCPDSVYLLSYCSVVVYGLFLVAVLLLLSYSFQSSSDQRSLMVFCDSKSPGFFLVFWPISTMLLSGWSPLVLLFPNPLVLIPVLWWPYQACLLQFVSPSPSGSEVFSALSQGLITYCHYYILKKFHFIHFFIYIYAFVCKQTLYEYLLGID